MIEQDGVKIETRFLDEDGQIMLVEIGGYIDQANVHHLQKVIDNSLESEVYKLIFDLKDLVYMSSAGWGVLIGEIKNFRENGGDIKLVNMNPEIYEVYQMLEFYHILSEYPTVEDALNSFLDKKQTVHARGEQPESPGLGQDVPFEEPAGENKTVEEFKDILNEMDATNSNGQEEEFVVDMEDIDSVEAPSKDFSAAHQRHVEFNPISAERVPDLKILPLPEKIKKVVAQFPHFGPWKIRKMLRHPEFGNTKVSYFKVRKILKQLDLDTKEKRYRFYRSC